MAGVPRLQRKMRADRQRAARPGLEPRLFSNGLKRPGLFLYSLVTPGRNKRVESECTSGRSHRLVTLAGAVTQADRERRTVGLTAPLRHAQTPVPAGPQLPPTWLARSSLSVACRVLSRAASWSRAARRSRSLRRTLSSCCASWACAPLSRPSTPRRAAAPQPHQAWPGYEVPSLPSTHHRALEGLPVWTHRGGLTREGPPEETAPQLRSRWPGQGHRSCSGQSHRSPRGC